METKIFKFILKLRIFGRGGVNGEFSFGNFSLGILVFRNSSCGILVLEFEFWNSRILCVIARERSDRS